MTIQTKLNFKQSTIEQQDCEIVAAIKLDIDDFERFENNLLNDQEFILDYASEMYDRDGTAHCILAYCDEKSYGVLMNSEGSFYARCSAIIPEAKAILAAEMKKIADYCVNESIQNSDDGKWCISFDEIYEHFGTEITPSNGLGELLLKELGRRKEIEDIDVGEYDFEIQCKKKIADEYSENIPITFYSLLLCGLEGCHLSCVGSDNTTMYVTDINADRLSEEGEREFADLLNARVVKLLTAKHSLNICLDGVAFDRVERFANVMTQNCTLEDYYKYTIPKEGEERIIMRPITQRDVDIAAAEHALWGLDHPNGKKAVFENCDFYNIEFESRAFNGAIFAHCRFRECNMNGVQLCFASLCASEFYNCTFESVLAENSDWTDTDVRYSEFDNSVMRTSNLTNASFDDCDFVGTDLQYCCLENTDFKNSYVQGADMDNCSYEHGRWETEVFPLGMQ